MTEPEARVNGEPILWMGNRFYNYVPEISESSGDPESEDPAHISEPGFEFAVRSAWRLWSSFGVASPPREMRPLTDSMLDRICVDLGTRVTSFVDPAYGPFEVYRLDWGETRRPPVMAEDR